MSAVTAVPLRPIAKGSLAKLWIGVALLLLVAVGLAFWGTLRFAPNEKGTAQQFMAWNARQDGVLRTASGLQYKILAPGNGPAPTDKDVATIAYKGELRDGTVFSQAPSVQVPVGQMVPGFSEALKMMPRGTKMKIWLPPQLGYGDTPPPESPIPKDAVLVFEIDMLQFADLAELQRQMMMGGMGGMGGGAMGGDPRGMGEEPHGEGGEPHGADPHSGR